MKTYNRLDSNKNTDKTNGLSGASDVLSINDLSEQERENYEIKKKLINLEGFANMRMLTKEDLLIQELTARGYSPEEIHEIAESLKGVKGERNTLINKLLMETVLLPKLEKTYMELKVKGGSAEAKKTLDECHENAINFIHQHLRRDVCENNKLRSSSKAARGEIFLFITNENKNKYIVLELQKTDKEMGIDILNDQGFFIRIHFDENTDITKMSDILAKGKKLLDMYSMDKKIRYVIVSCRLFDDEFNDFWMKERVKEGKKEIPNRIRIREERLKYYGGRLPSQEPHPDDPIEVNFLDGEENSMTRTIRKYKSEGKKLKEGGGYIDLEALEKRKSEHGKTP